MNMDCVNCFSIPVIKIPRPLAEGSLFGLVGLKGWSASLVAGQQKQDVRALVLIHKHEAERRE